MAIYFVMFEATPRLGTRPSVGGAFVNCWIEGSALEQAVEIARLRITENDWIVNEPDDAFSVDETTYSLGSDGWEEYQQALLHNEVYVYHEYPDDEVGAASLN